MSGSFLDSLALKLGEIEWGEDDCGPFWSAAYFDRETGTQLGITGSYYDVDESGKRESKEDQEFELIAFAASK